MMNRFAFLTLLACGELLLTATLSAGGKKLIELGWDIPDTAYLREHHAAMEKDTPFDGVMFSVSGQDEEGRIVSTRSGWDPKPWKREWFATALTDLQACKFERFTDNFVRFNATPTLLDWADDKAWETLAEKMKICAWLMREGGARGIAPDFEPYGENQWRFDPALGRSFSETATLARKRGAQWIEGIASEMKDAVILTLFLNSVNRQAGENANPEAILASAGYGLLPAFFNGMLDAAPPEMTIVDGCESGYYYDSVEAYQKAALGMRSWSGPSARLVAPENRMKYRAQVQAGFGFYLDMFVNPEGNRFYRGPLDGSRLKHLYQNLTAAVAASDEYVWLYGEQSRWWTVSPWSEDYVNARLGKTAGKGRLWEEVLPGVTRMIRWGRDAAIAAEEEFREMEKLGKFVNVLPNGDLQKARQGTDKHPDAWGTWQDGKTSKGEFLWEAGRATMKGVAWGCWLQGLPAEAGQVFIVRADCQSQGDGTPTLVVRWQTAEGSWINEIDDKTFPFPKLKEGKSQALGAVVVPEGAQKIMVLLSMHGQKDAGDQCIFENIGLYPLPEFPF